MKKVSFYKPSFVFEPLEEQFKILNFQGLENAKTKLLNEYIVHKNISYPRFATLVCFILAVGSMPM